MCSHCRRCFNVCCRLVTFFSSYQGMWCQFPLKFNFVFSFSKGKWWHLIFDSLFLLMKSPSFPHEHHFISYHKIVEIFFCQTLCLFQIEECVDIGENCPPPASNTCVIKQNDDFQCFYRENTCRRGPWGGCAWHSPACH